MIDEKRLKTNLRALAVLADKARRDLLEDILKIIDDCKIDMKSPTDIKEMVKHFDSIFEGDDIAFLRFLNGLREALWDERIRRKKAEVKDEQTNKI